MHDEFGMSLSSLPLSLWEVRLKRNTFSHFRYFVEENPNDETAQNFLEVANSFEDGLEFNTSKDKMSKAISKHLISNARSSQYYKYLYFYKHSQSQVQSLYK